MMNAASNATHQAARRLAQGDLRPRHRPLKEIWSIFGLAAR